MLAELSTTTASIVAAATVLCCCGTYWGNARGKTHVGRRTMGNAHTVSCPLLCLSIVQTAAVCKPHIVSVPSNLPAGPNTLRRVEVLLSWHQVQKQVQILGTKSQGCTGRVVLWVSECSAVVTAFAVKCIHTVFVLPLLAYGNIVG